MNVNIKNLNLSNEYIQITDEAGIVKSMDLSDLDAMILYHTSERDKLLNIKSKYLDLKK